MSPADGYNLPNTTTKTVAAAYRTNEQISSLLQQIAGQSTSDEDSRRRALNVLDDLAEAMIGRRLPADVTLKAEIQMHCERLRGTSG